MPMSEFKKKALREMNIRFAWAVLIVTAFFRAMDWVVDWFTRNLTRNLLPYSVQEMGLPAVLEGVSYSSIIKLILLVCWIGMLLVLLFKWTFRQINARRA